MTTQHTPSKLVAECDNLLGEYWDIAQAEVREERNHDTLDGAANRTLFQLRTKLHELAAMVSSARAELHAAGSNKKSEAVRYLMGLRRQSLADHGVWLHAPNFEQQQIEADSEKVHFSEVVVTPLYATPPAVAQPIAPKLIGWRTSDFLRETNDLERALHLEAHYQMLPIFEGDPNTQLTQPQP